MVLFATPDFGAGGMIFGLVLIAWAVVLATCIVGFICGVNLLSTARKFSGSLLMLVSFLLPIFFYVAPPHLFRLAHGSYPLGTGIPASAAE